MSSTNKTPHYNLSQFGDSPDDKPSWRGDYTADMNKIDDQMYANAQAAQAAQTAATSATGAAQAASQAAQTSTNILHNMGLDEAGQGTAYTQRVATVETTANNNASYFSALGITSTSQAQALLSTINSKADASSVSTLSAQLSQKANAGEVYTQAQSDSRYLQAGGYSGNAQALNNAIQQNTTNIAGNTSNISLLQAFVNEFTNDANWRKTHLQGTIGAFTRDMFLMYNETLKMFRVYGFVFQPGTSAGGSTVTSSVSDSSHPQGGLASGYLPESLRPSADYEIQAAGTSYSVQPSNYSLAPLIGSARLRIKTTGQIEFTFSLGGTGSNNYSTTCFFQPCLYFAAIHP